MAVSDKIRALLKMTRKTQTGLAEKMDISRQALSNKLYRESFSAEDLIRIAEYTEVTLLFSKDENNRVVLEVEDIALKKGGDK